MPMTRKYTDEYRKKACDEWQASGLSKKRFCKERNINEPLFYRWIKKYGCQTALTKKQFTPIKFFQVDREDSTNKGNHAEITLPNGIALKVEYQSLSSVVRELLL
jgi:transposase-like protein